MAAEIISAELLLLLPAAAAAITRAKHQHLHVLWLLSG
jgi:hypothetical protein